MSTHLVSQLATASQKRGMKHKCLRDITDLVQNQDRTKTADSAILKARRPNPPTEEECAFQKRLSSRFQYCGAPHLLPSSDSDDADTPIEREFANFEDEFTAERMRMPQLHDLDEIKIRLTLAAKLEGRETATNLLAMPVPDPQP
jgi:hypothetical protein